MVEKILPPAGLKPRTPRSVGQDLTQATGLTRLQELSSITEFFLTL